MKRCTSGGHRKGCDRVKLERSINLKPYLSQQSHARQVAYNLGAAIIHYVALDVGTRENAIYNDESVSQKRKNFIDNIRVQREVYMLFYTRQCTHSGSGAEKVPIVVQLMVMMMVSK